MKKNNKKIYLSILAIVAILLLILYLNEATPQDDLPSDSEVITSTVPSESQQPEEFDDLKVSDYFNYKKNTVYKYVSVNNNSSIDNLYNQERYLMHNDGNTIQVKIIIPGAPNEFVEVMEVTDDSAILLYADSKYNHINFINNLPAEDNYTVMKKPLSVGSNWEVNSTSVSEVTNLNVEVEVPFGKFNAIEIATNHSNGGYTKNYYVKDIGLIKTIVSSAETGEHISVLDSIIENASVSSSYVDKFNYDVVNDEIVLEREQLVFGTNPDYEAILEKVLKTASSENFIPLLSEDTTINSISVTYDNVLVEDDTSSVTLDLSKEFITGLNVGASIEQTLIECIVKTVGRYYGVNSVTILIDGEAIEDGHSQFGEPMDVQ